MLSKIGSKKAKVILIAFSYLGLFLSTYLQLFNSMKIHHVLGQNHTLAPQTITVFKALISIGLFLSLIFALLIIIVVQNYKQLSLVSILIRTTLVFLPMALIKLGIALGFKDFSFTWISFAIEMMINYCSFLLLGVIVFFLVRCKLPANTKTLNKFQRDE